MTRIAANLSMLFTEAPLAERFGRAARAGFRAVELQFPYELPADTIRRELDAHGLPMVLHNLPAGDWAKGDRGLAAHPGRVEEFRAGVARGVAYAKALGVPRLNALAGIPPADAEPALVRRTLVENLRFAAAALGEAGLALVVEPINTFDVPGFAVSTTAQALSVLDEVGAPNAFVQYDIYHAQRMEGDVANTLSRHLARIGHVQFADNPGRHEPGTGELNFDFLFAHLKHIGWRGDVGAEYKPAGATEAGLGWLPGAQRLFGD
jgi:hydroxypyruvate isomerase